MSSCLCKYGEGAGFPFQVKSLENGVEDAVDTGYIHKTNHGPGAAAHFDEAALDHVGGAQFAPQVPGKGEEGKQLRQVALQPPHHTVVPVSGATSALFAIVAAIQPPARATIRL